MIPPIFGCYGNCDNPGKVSTGQGRNKGNKPVKIPAWAPVQAVSSKGQVSLGHSGSERSVMVVLAFTQQHLNPHGFTAVTSKNPISVPPLLRTYFLPG